jgi:hypothetical protein
MRRQSDGEVARATAHVDAAWLGSHLIEQLAGSSTEEFRFFTGAKDGAGYFYVNTKKPNRFKSFPPRLSTKLHALLVFASAVISP